MDLAQKTTIVSDIDRFLSSLGGKYYLKELRKDYEDRTEFMLNAPIDDKYTPFTREGFIGELRQLKATEHILRDIKAQLVDEIKEQTETNQ